MALDYCIIGKRIKEIRISRKLSQAALSEKIGVSPTYISYIECGAKKMSIETLVKMANTLGVSADSILADSLKFCRRIYCDEPSEILSGCSATETKIIIETMKSLKVSLHDGYSASITHKRTSGNKP